MKSFLVTLVIWAVAFAVLWFGAHELFYPPGDWIGAALVSFFFALGTGGLRRARIERRDAAIVARAEGAPADGERVAIAGTLEAIGETLHAPLSGEPCLVYDYSISHIPKQSSLTTTSGGATKQPSPVIDHSGMAVAPLIIRSNLREVRILTYPGLEDFPDSELDEGTAERARRYIAATKFEDVGILDMPGQVMKVTGNRTGSLRTDWKLSPNEDLEDAIFKERRVPLGTKACVVGLYSKADNAIVPQANTGGVRLIRGTRDEALASLRGTTTASLIVAALFLLIPGPIVYGVLTHRENYFNEHNQPSVMRDRIEAYIAAVNGGDLPAVRKALHHGVDVNTRDTSGNGVLSIAPDAPTATALIEAGADIHARGNEGLTPIMMAAARGRPDVVRLLIAKGANVNEKNAAHQMTPLEFAVHNGHDDVAEIIRKGVAQ
jgi:hypothetical protein